MKRSALSFFLGISSALASPLAPDDALKSFQHEPDVRVELVAAEPLVASPCALAFDERGRLFVVENRGYPNTANPPQGTVAMLEDTDADGRMDKRIVFADGLTFPNGVLPWQGGVLVTCAPDLLFLKDTDGDGRADVRRVELTGFATGGSTQLRVNTPTLGPDSWIYLAAGLSGGEITSPAHPQKPALKMTGDLRWQPRTGEFENVDGRSQYGMSFDDFGRRFICMNRIPVQHVVLSSKVLARNPHLAFSETVQDCSERTVQSALRSRDSGVRLFPISANITTADSHAGSFSAACGIHIWRGGALPQAYRGCAFTCDPTANLVHVDKLVPRGATFSAEPLLEGREFLASRDDWFRPVFLASGPDGALYIADMYRKVIEHPDYLPEEVRKRTDFESGKEMGRIWRVKGTNRARDKVPRVNLEESGWQCDATAMLSHDNGWTRQLAFRLFVERMDANSDVTFGEQFWNAKSPSAQIALLRLWSLRHGPGHDSLQVIFQIQDPRFREALLMCGENVISPHSQLSEFSINAGVMACATSDDPRVRFACALALGRRDQSDHPGDIDPRVVPALALIGLHDASDRWTRAAVLSSIGGHEQAFATEVFNRIGDEEARHPNLLIELGALLGRASASRKPEAFPSESMTVSEGLPMNARVAFLAGLAEGANMRVREDAQPSWVDGAVSHAVTLAGQSDAIMANRLSAISLLKHVAWKIAHPALVALLARKEPIELRNAAISALAAFDEAEAAGTLLDAKQWNGFTPVERQMTLGSLLARTLHTPHVLDAIESGALARSALTPAQRAALSKDKDAAIRQRAEKLFGAAVSGDRKQAFENAKAALALKADAAHGREVFRTACATCHRLEREGFVVGPDLFEMRNQPKENILFHIVVPDAEIVPVFSGYLAETNDGRTLSGVLAAETPTSLLLRLPGGTEETLLRSNVAKLEALPGSLMPPGLEAAISMQDLADLLAFLKGEAAR